MMFVIVSPIARGFPSRFTLRIVAMELPLLLVYRVRRFLRWPEEDEEPQALRDGLTPGSKGSPLFSWPSRCPPPAVRGSGPPRPRQGGRRDRGNGCRRGGARR